MFCYFHNLYPNVISRTQSTCQLCDSVETDTLALRLHAKDSAVFRNEQYDLAENDMEFFEQDASRANYYTVESALTRLERIATALATRAADARRATTAAASERSRQSERKRTRKEREPVTLLRDRTRAAEAEREGKSKEISQRPAGFGHRVATGDLANTGPLFAPLSECPCLRS